VKGRVYGQDIKASDLPSAPFALDRPAGKIRLEVYLRLQVPLQIQSRYQILDSDVVMSGDVLKNVRQCPHLDWVVIRDGVVVLSVS
jgi:hypothetical protein